LRFFGKVADFHLKKKFFVLHYQEYDFNDNPYKGVTEK